MSANIVEKFGGTSMAHPEKVAGIVEARDELQIIITSAPGGDEDTSLRMTKELKRLAIAVGSGDTAAASEIASAGAERYRSIYHRAFGADIAASAEQIARQNLLHLPNRSAAHIVGLGEIISAQCFAKAIGAEFVMPEWIRFTTDGIQLPDRPEFLTRILEDKNRPSRIVVPGFVGVDDHGNIHVMGPGASDQTGGKTGKIAGSVFGDHNVVYENWTDVNGILSGNPNIVNNPRTIPELTRREVREGAHGGTGVLQGDTIVDLDGSTIPVNIRNTLKPDQPGSWVLPERDSSNGDPIIAVTGRDDIVEVSIDDLGMAEPPSYVASVTTLLGSMGLSLEHMPMARDAFSFTIHNGGDATERAERMHRIGNFAEQVAQTCISKNASVEVNERGVVYMIGEQLRNPRVLSNATIRALGIANQNDAAVYETVSHGTSPSLALLTDRDKVDTLIAAIHTAEIEKSVDLFGATRNL